MERNISLRRALTLGIMCFVCRLLFYRFERSGHGHGRRAWQYLRASRIEGFGLETPDCGHNVRHVREVFDSALGKNVFAFDAHRDLDNDRCTNFDRQRMEVKTAPATRINPPCNTPTGRRRITAGSSSSFGLSGLFELHTHFPDQGAGRR